jgi:hypothetical protein
MHRAVSAAVVMAGNLMTIFDAAPLRPPWKYRRLALFLGSGIVIAAAVIFWLLRYHAEYATVRRFEGAVVAGDFQQAYQIWKPSSSYSYEDFLQDWGPNGYYGPVKSYQIDYHLTDRRGSAASITVDVSPYQPFPDDDDPVKMSKTKAVRLWVQFNDQSMSFPPD